MLRNYITVALRALRRNPLYTSVNVFGLALGMAACVLIMTLVHFEWRFDRYHEASDRIYRTYFHFESPDGSPNVQAMMTPEFTPEFKASFPVIERATRLVRNSMDFRVADETYHADLAEVDHDFFTMFTVPLLAGDRSELLTSPNHMVINSTKATAWFGSANAAVGQVVSIPRGENVYDFEIVAVFEDFPAWSSINFEVAISFENYGTLQLGGNNWGGRTSTYILLDETADADAFEAELTPWATTAFAEYIENARAAEVMSTGDDAYALRIQPISELHHTPAVFAPYERAIHNPLYSWILAGIGFMILLIACINFMTLSVGQSSKRAREVGVRKVLGAERGQLMKQYFGESMVLAGGSLFLGLATAVLLEPIFSNLTGRDLSVLGLSPMLLFGGMLVLLVVVGGIAGGYPAAVLSRFHPARVLKGDTPTTGRGMLTRSLVVLQYTISIGLLASLFIMSQQIDYLFSRDLGFDSEKVIAIQARQIADSRADDVVDTFRDIVLRSGYVEEVARAGQAFTRSSDRNGWRDGDGVQRQAYNFGVSYEYLDVMGMELVEGRNFSREFPADPTNSILVNEALVREFGLENPIGTVMTNWLSFIYDTSPTIIGVVSDFNFQSLHNSVQPAVMNMHPDYYNYFGTMLVRLRPGDTQGALEALQAAWEQVVPDVPYSYSFVSEDMAQQYATEQQWRTIVTWASGLALLIACLGLFGLALLTVTRRMKEIGVRKVMGAGVGSIVALVSREFAVLVVVASVIAAPLSWVAMNRWLDNFAFRIDINPAIFLAAAGASLFVALATVAYHAFSAARMDPVKTLRHD